MPAYTSEKYDDLFAGYVGEVLAVPVIIKATAGVLTRGTVLGIVTASVIAESDQFGGTPTVSVVNSALTDGTQTPYGILADVTVDATSLAVRATAYLTGEFNRAALKFGGADTIVTHDKALRNIGIITKRVVK
jgi:uncharacterized protein YwbE